MLISSLSMHQHYQRLRQIASDSTLVISYPPRAVLKENARLLYPACCRFYRGGTEDITTR